MSLSHTADVTLIELVERLREKRSELQAHGIVSVSIFGSRARGDNRPDSDVDVLIDYDRARKFSLVDLVHVEHMIQGMLGLDVQVTTLTSVPQATRARIEAGAVQVF